MKNYRYFIATLMLAIAGAFQASAQVTETPYSRLGYGTLGDNATGIQRHMGGVGYAMQGGRAVNSKNPASYAATDSLTFIWDVGVDVSQVWSKEGDTKRRPRLFERSVPHRQECGWLVRFHSLFFCELFIQFRPCKRQ